MLVSLRSSLFGNNRGPGSVSRDSPRARSSGHPLASSLGLQVGKETVFQGNRRKGENYPWASFLFAPLPPRYLVYHVPTSVDSLLFIHNY